MCSRARPELRALLRPWKAGDYYTEIVGGCSKRTNARCWKPGGYVEIDTRPFAETAREVALDFEKRGFWKKGLYDEVQSLL